MARWLQHLVASVGSVGDSYDSALAETIVGLYKTELIERQRPWKSHEQVEYQTFKWIDWFNHRHLMETLGNVPPAGYEDAYYAPNNRQVIRA